MRTTLARALVALAWCLYAVALCCPAVRPGRGDETWPGGLCLVVTLWLPFWLVWPVALGGIANLTFLFGSLLFAWGRLGSRAYGVWLMFAAFGALVVLISLIEAALVGGYIWLASLFIAAFGFLLDRAPEGAEP